MGIPRKFFRKSDCCLLWINNHVASSCAAHLWRKWWYRKIMGFVIFPKASILPDVRFSRRGNFKIGSYSVINNAVRIDNRYPVQIGEHSSISYATLLLTEGHDIDAIDFRAKGAGITIGNYVWICARSIINPGVTIGDGAVVLPGSVAAHDVPPYTIVGGVPACSIRERRKDLDHNIEWNPIVPPLG